MKHLALLAIALAAACASNDCPPAGTYVVTAHGNPGQPQPCVQALAGTLTLAPAPQSASFDLGPRLTDACTLTQTQNGDHTCTLQLDCTAPDAGGIVAQATYSPSPPSGSGTLAVTIPACSLQYLWSFTPSDAGSP